jgi:hypothetical protein
MAHTVSKQIYCDEEKKYVQCEILVLDEEEKVPETDRREIVLYCTSCGAPYSELSDTFTSDINDAYPETELIDQYEDFDNRQGD